MTGLPADVNYVGKIQCGNTTQMRESLERLDLGDWVDILRDFAHRHIRENLDLILARDQSPMDFLHEASTNILPDSKLLTYESHLACLIEAYQTRTHVSNGKLWHDAPVYEILMSAAKLCADDKKANQFFYANGDTIVQMLEVLTPQDEGRNDDPYLMALSLTIQLRLKPDIDFWRKQLEAQPEGYAPMAFMTVMEQVSPYDALNLLPEIRWTSCLECYMGPALATMAEKALKDDKLMQKLMETAKALPASVRNLITTTVENVRQ